MPEDSIVPASLAYRKNHDAIWRGTVPEKYSRLLPYVTGCRVLEIGAAEGVLSLLLAERGHSVTAIERRDVRHAEALQLQARWKAMGRKVDGCTMVEGDIIKRPDLLQGIDCLVAVRVIYHLREAAPAVMAAAAAAEVPRIVLCGNKNRAARFEAGRPDEGLGEFNFYSTIKGMSALLEEAGYAIEKIVAEGDPIVIGAYHQGSPI